jgi:hypothetical protein
MTERVEISGLNIRFTGERMEPLNLRQIVTSGNYG